MNEKGGSYKYLGKNIGLLTISNFGTKLLVFFLVPLYTAVLSTEAYGIYDLINNTVSLLIPIFTINISEGVLRFCLDKNEKREDIFSIAIRINFIGFLCILALLGFNHVFLIIPTIDEYKGWFLLLYLSNSIYQLMSNFVRGLDDVLDVSIAGALLSITSILCNIIFLILFKWGLTGYFLAFIIGNLFAIFFFIFRLKLWKYFGLSVNNRRLQKEMIAYSVPMILTTISWWINNASDRYIVIAFCGIAVNGIYSVGYKIPSILNVFQSVFNQAWVLSSVREFDPEDKDGFFAETYNTYSCLMVIVASAIIILTKLLARIMYAKDFYEAWVYVPFLTIAIIFGAMSGYIGGIFSAVKNTKALSLTVVIGATVNIILNFLLVKKVGAIGAAIATMVSYFVVWQIRIFLAKKYMILRISLIRDYMAYIVLIIQAGLIIYLVESVTVYFALVLLLAFLLVLYRKNITGILVKIHELHIRKI